MPKYVLLDSNIVIEAYRLGIWQKLIERVEICVSSIVAHTESLFYTRKEKRIPEAINLKKLIAEGKIKEYSATVEDFEAVCNLFDRVFIEGIHDGETECLALIFKGSIENTRFCTSDAMAIKALAMIGHKEMGISFETLLKQSGLQQQLRRQFTQKFFKDNLAQGAENRITGSGLKKV